MKNTHQLRFAMLLAQFSFTSVALAAGKLTPAPEAANEYVRVWSDTIGVHEVQNPDGGLDFWITTTNVVDGFTAEVVVEEIDEDSWRLKEPQSGKRNPMHPGDKLKYVVEDVSGVEPDKTGWIKLYRVDVMIDDVGEANEEADGALVAYKTAPGGYNDPAIAKYLVPVALRCFTPDEDDVVTIEIRNSTLLVRNDSGGLEEAQSSYIASELSDLRFFLLGTQASTSECDQEIVLTHDKTKCKDVAKFSVWQNASFVIQEVSFQNANEILSDLGVPFEPPQYKDSNHDGVISGAGEKAVPVLYVRNTQPTIAAKIYHPSAKLTPPVYVRAESPAFRIPCTPASIDSDTVISIASATETTLADKIDFQDPLPVRWFVSTDNKSSWQSAGISTNRFYVTWAASRATQNLETLFFIGCPSAKGVSGIVGLNDDRVFNCIWNIFSSRSMPRAHDGLLLTYYGYRDSNRNGLYDTGIDRDCSEIDIVDFANLIAVGNGQCHAFVDIFIQSLLAQGLATINGIAPVSVCLDPKYGAIPFAVKNWETCEPARHIPPRAGKYFNIILPAFAGVTGLHHQHYSLKEGEAKDIPGVPGQGTSPNPPEQFDRHYILRYGDKYFDPSYGSGPFNDRKTYEDGAFCGFIEAIETGVILGIPLTELCLHQNFKASDGNPDTHDDEDFNYAP